MKRFIALASVAALAATLGSGCLYEPRTRAHQGAVVGGVVGGTTGMVLDQRHPWRGGIIGGVLGAMVGATLADVSDRAATEAAHNQQPAEYRTEDGRGLYRAEPQGYNSTGRCRTVRERVWQDGRLVRDQVREICTSNGNQPVYHGR